MENQEKERKRSFLAKHWPVLVITGAAGLVTAFILLADQKLDSRFESEAAKIEVFHDGEGGPYPGGPPGSPDAGYDAEAEAEFDRDASRISDDLEVYTRFFKETNRSCLDADCRDFVEGCVKWNKFKKDCYESRMVCQSDPCSRYKIYCNLIVMNKDESPVEVTFDTNYQGRGGDIYPVGEETVRLDPGHGHSAVWEYDVDAANTGQCRYENISATPASL